MGGLPQGQDDVDEAINKGKKKSHEAIKTSQVSKTYEVW